MHPDTIISLISVCVAFASLIFVAITFTKNTKKGFKDEIEKEDSRFEGIKESTIKINMKLDALCGTANETRADVKTINKDMVQLQTKIATIDDRISSLDTRLTSLENKVYDK